MRSEPEPGVDGVRLAVMNSRFQAVARNMMNTLLRTGRSGVLNTARDFSCCLLTAQGDLLAAADSIPIHVMSGPDIMAKAMQDLCPDMKAGDAFLHNSPYRGNSHAADHCIVVPVIDDDGVHRFTVVAKAHQADCGNAVATTYMPDPRDVYEEGALIFDFTQVQSGYEDKADIIRMCKLRIRVPDQWWGDYLALLGSARIGERGLLDLGSEFGWNALDEYTDQWFEYSERRMASEIRKLPTGRLVATSAHDPFPGVPDGIQINAKIDVLSEDGIIEIDLRDNPDCQPCGLNLTESTSRTAAMVGVFNSLGSDVPPNAGSFRRLRIRLRENCCVGIPRHPISCSMATNNLANRVANSVQRGIAQLADGLGMAEAGLSLAPAASVISGSDPRAANEPFINQVFLALTGGAAAPTQDAWLTLHHVGVAGMMYKDSVEVDELHHPIRIQEQRIVADSEGAGTFRGAPSARVEFGPVNCQISVMYASDGTVNPALGVRGGHSGGPASQFKRDAAGDLREAPACGPVTLKAGESIVSVSSGGGGYGVPHLRSPERVQHDVLDGWISQKKAALIYGVALDGDGNVDQTETTRLRTGRDESLITTAGNGPTPTEIT